ncbi:spore germination protein [Ruminiclostridium herbifermentans]|uniref:Spore germination protein n=1 Tax=Ruminiclostridium herbifermentans TaxID=2488810 RepID=A0A4U7JCU6_9FIRM|nr:spore germination protein [Ruminiclostridium herbifermentans]QNU65675.1 spore germination protein [Ruminiclostridium herbifermentans]
MGLFKSISKYIIYKEKPIKNDFVLEENKAINCDTAKNVSSLDVFNKKELEGAFIGCPVKDDILKNKITNDIELNKKVIKTTYDIPKNSDIVLREFNLTVKEKSVKAFIIFIDGMTNSTNISNFILQPLMLLSNIKIYDETKAIGDYIFERLITYNQIEKAESYTDVVSAVNFGGCGIFIEDLEYAFVADIKTWEHRGIDAPKSETVIRGPQEAFNEQLRSNTALIRKILKDKDLIIQSVSVGDRSNTPCAVLYIKDIANDSLVREVLKRVKSIKVDYIFDSGELEQLLEDSTFLTAPQIFATERPDKVAMMLSQGNVAVILDGSPHVLVMPATITEFLHTTEDSNVRYPYVNFIRIIRIIGIALALLLPGTYIAITNFHQEMIPTNLLFAIEASRENVPFPSIIEILIMEFCFELIREAGLRVPGAIGSTIGIVGGLILGQAAVSANVASPIMIIIVAITALGSFTVPSFSMSFSVRIIRFAYIILGAIAGFLGISLGLVINSLVFASSKSFGVPFLTPFAPITNGKYADKLTRKPTWKQERRPDYLNVKNIKSQPKISRGWTEKDSDTEDDK